MFDFGVRVLTAEGAVDSRFSFEGMSGFIKTGLNQEAAYASYPIVAEATCQLSARGGCLSGGLEIVGGGIDWPKLDDGQFVEFYWSRHESASKFYSGRIARGADRAGTGNTHKYKLQGAFESLDWTAITAAHFLGYDEGAGGTNTVSLCVSYYLEEIMGITSLSEARDIRNIGTITANSTSVKALTVTEDTKPKEFFETLEFMATGDDGSNPPRIWIFGVDENRLPYFKPLAQATIALTVQHGDDHAFRPLVDWNEQVITRLPPGRVRIWGGAVQSGDQAGLVANMIYSNAETGIGSRLVQKPHPIYAETLDSGVDMQLMATGWFKKFGRRIPIVQNMSYIADEPPRPWNGFVRFKRQDENGDLQNQDLFWDSADFALSQGPVIRIAIGDEQEPRTSRNQGLSPVRRMFRELAGVVDLVYPTLSREDAPVTPVGGGGAGIVYLPPHGGRGFYDGGFSQYLSGGR